MINRFASYLTILFTLISLQSCDDKWDFDIPGCMDSNSTNYDSNATVDNGSCYFTPAGFYVDASNYDEWIYFSFNNAEILNIPNPDNSIDWDIAFKRNHIKTNGGLSGIGEVCAIADESQIWTDDSFISTEQIFEGDCMADELIGGNIITYEGCYNNNTHLFEDCVKNPALDLWGYFDNAYYFSINNYQFFIKDVNGNYLKIWLMSYYDTNGESGKISLTYLFLD